MKKIGLISGMGELPKAIALDAKARGYRVVAVALEPLADRGLADLVDEIRWINVGKLGAIIKYLKGAGITKAVMAGKVPKSLIYEGKIIPDVKAIKLLFSLKDRRDDSILLAITGELEKEGISLLNTTDFCAGLLAPRGIITKKGPSVGELKDIAFGWRIAKEMGRLDIGQTVVVKNKAVMAVEAIEGTDEAIRRGGRLAGPGAVVVKVAKPEQDMRFDVPGAGPDTLRTMIEVGASVLAVEAEKTLLLQRELFLKEADEAGISVAGFNGDPDNFSKHKKL